MLGNQTSTNAAAALPGSAKQSELLSFDPAPAKVTAGLPASAADQRPADYFLSVVVPVYNEQLVIRECVARLVAVLQGLACRYEIIFVNDGSRDATAALLEEERLKHENIRIVSFARNFGHQMAITAGMDYARGHVVITMDADLQDPPELIPEMVARWQSGSDVVYAKRRTRAGETWFKKWSAAAYYRVLRKLTDVNVPVDVGDFRLLSRAALDALIRIRERHRYLRGLVSWLGFEQSFVEYDRDKRFAGKSNYRWSRSIRLSIDGITSFSVLPLRAATVAGIVLAAAACFLALALLYGFFLAHQVNIGWAVVLDAVLLLGGIQLIFIGVLGEYVGSVHEEAKRRPLYVIREVSE
ncbi:MAG TPA: glycosyltransferase family 2 protein [Planktothrix sp.]|jgi:dolichol-phosphate mannosyltransferase